MARRKRAVRGLAKVPTSMLAAELHRRRRHLGPLTRELGAARARVEEIQSHIAALGGDDGDAPHRGRGGRRRPLNKAGLAEALAGALRGKTMGVAEATEAALRSGYRSTAENFRVIVNAAIIKRRDLFRKVRRGKYTAK